MRSAGLLGAGGLAGLIGAVILIVEGALSLADHVLGTSGDVLVWGGLGLVAIGAAMVVTALVQAPATDDAEPAAVSSDG